MTNETRTKEARDLFRNPTNAGMWWGLPLLIGVAAGFAGFSAQTTAFVWAGAFAWMAAGCILNALRCHRLHCYISGPIFILGAVACLLIGLGVLSGPHMLNNSVAAALILALLTFVPEWLWRCYA